MKRPFYICLAEMISVILLVLLLSLTPCFAQVASEAANAEAEKSEQKEVKKKKEVKLEPGVIASSGQFSKAASVGTSGKMQLDPVPEGEAGSQMPIRASISKDKKGRCRVSLTNISSEDTFSVRFKLVGEDDKGSRVLNRSYSATIRSGQSINRQTGCRSAKNYRVELVSGRKL